MRRGEGGGSSGWGWGCVFGLLGKIKGGGEGRKYADETDLPTYLDAACFFVIWVRKVGR